MFSRHTPQNLFAYTNIHDITSRETMKPIMIANVTTTSTNSQTSLSLQYAESNKTNVIYTIQYSNITVYTRGENHIPIQRNILVSASIPKIFSWTMAQSRAHAIIRILWNPFGTGAKLICPPILIKANRLELAM